jgi:hypothetical protein
MFRLHPDFLDIVLFGPAEMMKQLLKNAGAYANTLPSSLAWDAFHEGNGAASLAEHATADHQISSYSC